MQKSKNICTKKVFRSTFLNQIVFFKKCTFLAIRSYPGMSPLHRAIASPTGIPIVELLLERYIQISFLSFQLHQLHKICSESFLFDCSGMISILTNRMPRAIAPHIT